MTISPKALWCPLVDERGRCHSITLFVFCWNFLYFGSIIKVKLHLDRWIRRLEEILFKGTKACQTQMETMIFRCACLHICTNPLQHVSICLPRQFNYIDN
jgi:hypothetical protein